jgi:Flp pilus assembly protein TadG
MVIDVDLVTVATPTVSYTFSFDTANTVASASSTTDVSGQVLWLNSNTSDTKAVGSTLAWQATLPLTGTGLQESRMAHFLR